MDTSKILDKLTKINELINRGATEGERTAAKTAFQKIVKNANLSDDDLLEILPGNYKFSYSNRSEKHLLFHLCAYVTDKYTDSIRYYQRSQRNLEVIGLTKIQYIELSAMYEYFRRHMKSEYKKVVKTAVTTSWDLQKIGRKVNVAKERRNAQDLFLARYLTASKIDRYPIDAKTRMVKTVVDKTLLSNIRGGEYFKQVLSDERSIDHIQS